MVYGWILMFILWWYHGYISSNCLFIGYDIDASMLGKKWKKLRSPQILPLYGRFLMLFVHIMSPHVCWWSLSPFLGKAKSRSSMECPATRPWRYGPPNLVADHPIPNYNDYYRHIAIFGSQFWEDPVDKTRVQTYSDCPHLQTPRDHIVGSLSHIISHHFPSIVGYNYNWFGTFVIFPYVGNNIPNWLIFSYIFQRGRSTTNQINI